MVLSGCFSDWMPENNGTGVISINLSNGNADTNSRSILPWPPDAEGKNFLNDITYTITFTGNGEPIIIDNINGNQLTIRQTVPAGDWQIKIDAHIMEGVTTPATPNGEGMYYATGTASTNVKAGQTVTVIVPMNPICQQCQQFPCLPDCDCDCCGIFIVYKCIDGFEDHDFTDSWYETTPPTCTTPALVTEKCIRCPTLGVKTAEGRAALGHQGIGYVAATCTTVGNTGTGQCEREGCDVFVNGTIIPITHDWEGWVERSVATCIAPEFHTRDCSLCDEFQTQSIGEIDGTAHAWSGWTTIEATCMSPLVQERYCQLCFENDEQNVGNVNPSAHNVSDWEFNVIAATCTEWSKNTGMCSICNNLIEVNGTNPAQGHNFSNWDTVTHARYHDDSTDVCGTGLRVLKCVRYEDCGQINGTEDIWCLGTADLLISNSTVLLNRTLNVANVCIPNTVTGIAANAFGVNIAGANPYIHSVRIGVNVTVIGDEAFRGCPNLTTVIFAEGSGLITIGAAAFRDCVNLKNITLPDSVTSIGQEAFRWCYRLTSFKIPAGVTTINTGLFNGCYDLISLTIPAGITSIASEAFRDCTSLETVTFAEGSLLATIGDNVFLNCTSLESIEIPVRVTIIGSAFRGCTGLTEINFAEGSLLTTIGDSAFEGCTSLESITIPARVTRILTAAFLNCTKLAEVNFTADSMLNSIGISSFNGCTSLNSIIIPASVTEINRAFENCFNLTSVTFLGNGIGSPVFNGGAFLGDLRAKYLSAEGGIGTYTTTAPVNSGSVWTKQD